MYEYVERGFRPTTLAVRPFQLQRREVNPEELIQNPLRPSLMLQQKPSKVFDR